MCVKSVDNRECDLEADTCAVELCHTSLPDAGNVAACSVVGHAVGAPANGSYQVLQHQLRSCENMFPAAQGSWSSQQLVSVKGKEEVLQEAPGGLGWWQCSRPFAHDDGTPTNARVKS